MLKVNICGKETDIEKYVIYLEELRQSGKTNMYGATPYLQKAFGITYEKAKEVLLYWMNHYNELREKYQWR